MLIQCFPQSVITQTETSALFLPFPKKSLPEECLKYVYRVSYPKYRTEVSDGQELFSDSFFLNVITKANLSKTFHRKGINSGRVEKQNKTLS